MRARNLVVEFPTVTSGVSIGEATLPPAEQRLPGLITVDGPCLPGSQVLRLAVPGYFQEDPAPAQVVDEERPDVTVPLMTVVADGRLIGAVALHSPLERAVSA